MNKKNKGIHRAVLCYAGAHGHLKLKGLFSKPIKGE
jgi:hypothetical protein